MLIQIGNNVHFQVLNSLARNLKILVWKSGDDLHALYTNHNYLLYKVFIFSVLYKVGPPFYHASYVVMVRSVDGDSLSYVNSSGYAESLLTGHIRVTEQAAKVNRNLEKL